MVLPDEDDEAEEQPNNLQNVLVDENFDFEPEDVYQADASPATLIGIFCLKYALSERAMKALLELLRLRLDVSSIKNVADILNSTGTPPVHVQNACANCHADLHLGNCFEIW